MRLERLPAGDERHCASSELHLDGEYEKLWLLGLALDEPGNVWGIQSPPEDWT